MQHINNFSLKKRQVKIAITLHLLILFCLVFFGAPQRSILWSLLFLIYVKSNHIASTDQQLAADILFFNVVLKL